MVAGSCVDAVKAALEEARKKCWAKSTEEVLKLLKTGDPCVHGYFRFHLIRNIAGCISASIKTAKAIYIHGSSVTDNASVWSDINILVHVTKKDPKNKKVLNEVNAQMTAQYVKLLGLVCKDCFRLLDIKVMNDAELKSGAGPTAIMRSSADKPICLWKRGKGLCGTCGEE